MKHFGKILTLLIITVLLLSACVATTEEPLNPTPYSTIEPTPVTTPNPTLESAPEPVYPIELFKGTNKQNDDDKRIYISMETLNSALYEPDSLGFYLSVDILKDTIEFRDFILQAAEDYPATEDNYIRYGLDTKIELTNNGPEYLSVYVDYYTNTGGAHGNITRIAYNYSKDGTRLINFMDLVNEGVTLAEIEAEINQQIAKIIKDMGPAFYSDTVSLADFDPLPAFFIKDGVMVIYFQAYDIAAYAYGIPLFEMPPELFSLN